MPIPCLRSSPSFFLFLHIFAYTFFKKSLHNNACWDGFGSCCGKYLLIHPGYRSTAVAANKNRIGKLKQKKWGDEEVNEIYCLDGLQKSQRKLRNKEILNRTLVKQKIIWDSKGTCNLTCLCFIVCLLFGYMNLM